MEDKTILWGKSVRVFSSNLGLKNQNEVRPVYFHGNGGLDESVWAFGVS